MGQGLAGRFWLGITACALLARSTNSFAQDADDDAQDTVTRTPCALGRSVGDGTLEVTVAPPVYGSHVTTHEKTSTLFDVKGRQLLAFQQTVSDDEPEVTISCEDGRALLRSGEQQVPFLISREKIQLDPRFRTAVAQAWQKPARSVEALESRKTWQFLLSSALDSNAPGTTDAIADLDHQIADSLALLVARDTIALRDFDAAEGDLAYLSDRARGVKQSIVASGNGPARQRPKLSAANAARWAALNNQLLTARKRSAPVVLGPRRLLVEAPYALFSPLEFDAAPTLFWRDSELCVALPDAPPSAPLSFGAMPPAPVHMRCYAPATGRARPQEAFAPPPSSASHLLFRDFTSSWNRCSYGVAVWKDTAKDALHPCNGGPGVGTDEMLAVVDGDAIFARSSDSLRLVRGPGQSESVDAAKAREVVRRSAGTQLFVKSMSYFAPWHGSGGPFDQRIARLGGKEGESWDVFGAPPQGLFWVGAPLISPDQRWVTVQSGKPGSGPVSVWLFPIQ